MHVENICTLRTYITSETQKIAEMKVEKFQQHMLLVEMEKEDLNLSPTLDEASCFLFFSARDAIGLEGENFYTFYISWPDNSFINKIIRFLLVHR